ncbi:MAG: hypothetical protein WKF59_09805 [Chitinophagaceae bacterium]
MSFLKQLLNPFVEFDEHKKQEPQKSIPQVTKATDKIAPVADENAHHPLINENKTTAAASVAIPTFSQSGTITGPLPEHEKYFERLIDEANAKNPMFQGTDFKEFVDSKVDIDDITDEALKYKTAFNVLKSTGLTKEKLISTGQEYLNLIGRDLNSFKVPTPYNIKKKYSKKNRLFRKRLRNYKR